MEVLSQLSQVVRSRASTLQTLDDQCETFCQILQDCHTQHVFLRHHVSLVKENADRLGVQVSEKCIDMQNFVSSVRKYRYDGVAFSSVISCANSINM